MKTWAIVNQKGGVGKTTTTISLAGLLAKRGGRVLVIDSDPHGSLTNYLGLDPEDPARSLYQLFNDDISDIDVFIHPTRIDGLSIIKSSTVLATLERRIGIKDGKGLVIKHLLNSLKSRFDYTLIDCPPMLGVLMINALAACQKVIIPAQCEYLALNGLDRMVNTIDMINRSNNYNIEYLIVPTMVDRRTRVSSASIDLMKEKYHANMWRAYIPIDTKFCESSFTGLPIVNLYPKSRGALAYRVLLNDLLAHGRVAQIQSQTVTSL